MLAVGVASITIGAFGSTFFPVLTRELGFDLSAAGMGYSLMAFSEVPFLFFADRLLGKLGNFKILLLGLFLTGLRWFLTSLVDSFPLFMALQSLHGLNYVIVYYSVFNYIHFKLPGDVALKAQAIYWMSTMGISYLLGSVAGGFLVDTFGLKTVYFSLGMFGMLLSVVFTVVLIYTGKRFRPIN
jgi:PPP family 3-phenylpropionic acid transporter